MAFRFKGKPAIVLSIVTVFAVVLLITVFFNSLMPSTPPADSISSNQSSQPTIEGNKTNPENASWQDKNTTSPDTNVTRFVDTITKINPEGKSQDSIQESLDTVSFAPVIVQVDIYEHLDAVLSKLSKQEFKLDGVSESKVNVFFGGNATKTALTQLQNNPYVTRISYNFPTRALLQASVPLINASLVWNLYKGTSNITGDNVTICVTDTGVDYTHPDLGGCPSTSNINTANCSKVIGGRDIVSSDNNPMDTYGHGTHVTGIIAANGSAKGVAPGAKIVAVRISDDDTGAVLDFKNGVQWCIDHRNDFNPPISVISISFAVDYSTLYQGHCDSVDDVVRVANDAVKSYGLLVVAASGDIGSNDSINSPACGSNITSVGASRKDDDQMSDAYNNRNNLTDLIAPGVSLGGGINSTYISSLYEELAGTSQSAPHVAGAAALLLQLEPRLTPQQITNVLMITGKNMSYITDDPNLNVSRIDVYKAVQTISSSILRVTSLSQIYINDTHRIFAFVIKNTNLSDIVNISNMTNISWYADMGDGTVINGTANVTQLLLGETVLGRISHNYQKNGVYAVNVSARSGNFFHSKNITIYVGNLIISDLKAIHSSGLQKTFQFTIRNDMRVNLTSVNWTVDFGNGENVSSNQLISLPSKKELLVRLRYNYTFASTYNLSVSASNGTIIDTENITVTVT